MSLCTNVYRRGSRYYFRKRIPSDLRHLFPSDIYKVSLYTSNHLEAKERAVKLAAQLVNFFQGLRMTKKSESGVLASHEEINNSIQDMVARVEMSTQKRIADKTEPLVAQVTNLEMENIVKDRMLSKKFVTDQNPKLSDDVNGIENRFRQFMESRKGRINSGYFDLHPVIYGYFTSICGVKNVNDYDVEDCTKYKNIGLSIPQYPDNWEKYFGTKDLLKVLELNNKKKNQQSASRPITANTLLLFLHFLIGVRNTNSHPTMFSQT